MVAVLGAIAWALFSACAFAKADTESLAVMIQTADESGQATGYGAGLIVGYNRDNVYIVTANHVVRRQFGRLAPQVRVEVPSRPAEYLRARVLAKSDPGLDLGIIAVSRSDYPEFRPGDHDFERLARLSEVEVGDPARMVGNPNGRSWSEYSAAEVAEVRTDGIRLDADGVGKGYSGGPVFVGDRQVAGLLQGESGSSARVIRMDAILEALGEFGIPVALQYPATPDDGDASVYHVQKPAPIKNSTGLLAQTIGRLRVGEMVKCSIHPERPNWCAMRLKSGRTGYVEIDALDLVD